MFFVIILYILEEIGWTSAIGYGLGLIISILVICKSIYNAVCFIKSRASVSYVDEEIAKVDEKLDNQVNSINSRIDANFKFLTETLIKAIQDTKD